MLAAAAFLAALVLIGLMAWYLSGAQGKNNMRRKAFW